MTVKKTDKKNWFQNKNATNLELFKMLNVSSIDSVILNI